MEQKQLLTVDAVIDKLQNKPRDELITIASAAGVGKEWIFKLASGRIADPGARKIERLSNYLSSPDSAEAA